MFTKHYARCALHKSKLCTLHSAHHPTTLHTAAFPAERHGVFLPSTAPSSIHCILLCFFHNPIMPPDDDVEEIHLMRVFFHAQPTNLFPVYCASGLACPTIGGDPSPSARQVRRVFSVSQWHRGGLCQQESPPYVRGHSNFGQILVGTPEVLSYLHFQDRAPVP